MPEFESKDIPPEALKVIQDAHSDKSSQKKVKLSEAMAKAELHAWAKNFIQSSKDWRLASQEPNWQKFRRDADGKYDPQLASVKQDWQSKAFVPITPSHRETIQSALYRTHMGPRPPLEMKSRGTIDKDDDQSMNIRDLILREMEKLPPNSNGFEYEFNKVLDDSTTYGSGFARVRYEVRSEKRSVKTPAFENILLADIGDLFSRIAGTKQADKFKTEIKEVETFRGTIFEYLDIWDVYPDPNTTEIRGSTIGYRFETTLGEIRKNAKEGIYLKDAADGLEDEDSQGVKEDKEQWDQERDADREIADFTVERPDNAKKVQAHEVFARLPQKWVFLGKKFEGDPEELVPARVLFHEKSLMTVEINEAYDGEPQIYKLDYFSVNGQFYGRGIPEMLGGLQELINETVNQRVDNVGLAMNKMYAVNEKALVNRADLVNRPGGFIRLNGSKIQNGDIRNAITEFNTSDVTRSAYADVQEFERYAQERSSANRVTLGTQGQVSDSNKTLGGLELARQSAGEKFGYIGMLQEYGFLRNVYRAIWRTTYSNIEPDEILKALGEERAKTFKLLTPEEVDQDFRYVPTGIFTMENKALRQARLGQLREAFINEPWLDSEGIFDLMAKAADEDPDNLKLSEEDMVTKMGAQADLEQANASLQASQGAIQQGQQIQGKQQETVAKGILPNE
jgi:hypothetical protein